MRFVMTCITLLLSVHLAAAQPAKPDLNQVQQLISATGLDKHIQQIPEALHKTADSPPQFTRVSAADQSARRAPHGSAWRYPPSFHFYRHL